MKFRYTFEGDTEKKQWGGAVKSDTKILKKISKISKTFNYIFLQIYSVYVNLSDKNNIFEKNSLKIKNIVLYYHTTQLNV